MVPLKTAGPRPAATATDAKGKGRMSAIDYVGPDRRLAPTVPQLRMVPHLHTPVLYLHPGRLRALLPRGGQQVRVRGVGGFVIPAGVARPNRSGPPPHPSHTASFKRSAGDAFTSGKPTVTGAPGVGGKATMDRTVLGALEVGSDGAVLERVRR